MEEGRMWEHRQNSPVCEELQVQLAVTSDCSPPDLPHVKCRLSPGAACLSNMKRCCCDGTAMTLAHACAGWLGIHCVYLYSGGMLWCLRCGCMMPFLPAYYILLP